MLFKTECSEISLFIFCGAVAIITLDVLIVSILLSVLAVIEVT